MRRGDPSPLCRAVPGSGGQGPQRAPGALLGCELPVLGACTQRCPEQAPGEGVSLGDGAGGAGQGEEAEAGCPQEEYIREQIDWREMAFADNQPCINLISLKPYGVLRILDDQCCFPQVSLVQLSSIPAPRVLLRAKAGLPLRPGPGLGLRTPTWGAQGRIRAPEEGLHPPRKSQKPSRRR